MDDAARVGGLEGEGDASGIAQRLTDRQRTARQALGERVAGHELHDEEMRVAFLAGLVNRGDVGVVQGRERPGFALEAGQSIGVGRQLLRQDLDRHFPPELGVLGEIDLAHATLAELGGDPEVRQRPADQDGMILTAGREAIGGTTDGEPVLRLVPVERAALESSDRRRCGGNGSLLRLPEWMPVAAVQADS